MKLGNFTIQRIVEMVHPYVLPEDFAPQATPEALAPHRSWLEPWSLCPETGQFILAIQSWLVTTEHHTILIDTCIGCNKDSAYPAWHQRTERVWLERLVKAGVQPEHVDYIFCTHLHLDHVGWNTQLRDGRFVPTFPNARYIFTRTDVEQIQAENTPTFRQCVLPILEAGQAELVDGEFALEDTVWFEPTPGHTTGHVAVGMASGDSRAVMCGDLIHFPVQCAHPDWITTFDDDPAKACTTRKSFLHENCESGRLVLTAHFPATAMGYVERAGEAFRFMFFKD